jgi:hypothetical protein
MSRQDNLLPWKLQESQRFSGCFHRENWICLLLVMLPSIARVPDRPHNCDNLHSLSIRELLATKNIFGPGLGVQLRQMDIQPNPCFIPKSFGVGTLD